MKFNVASIKIWILVIVTFCLIQIFVIQYFYKTGKILDNYNYFSSQLNDIKNDFNSKDKSTYNVVVVGSSLVGHGIECPEELQKTLASFPIKNILIKKIWESGDPIKYFIEDKNLINELLIVKPDLVCLQTELAAVRFEDPEKNIYTNFKNHFEELRQKNIVVFKDLLFKKKSSYTICENMSNDDAELFDSVTYRTTKRFVKSGEEINYLLNGIKKLKNAGIKLVIVDIPKPQKVELLINNNLFLQNLNSLLDMYKLKLGIAHWTYAGRPMYFDDFIDGGHLNKAGRHEFTSSLIEKIINEIKATK